MNKINIFKSSIGKFSLIFSIIPVILLSVILTSISTNKIRESKIDDAKNILKASANDLAYAYYIASDGNMEFKVIDDRYYIGDLDITNDYKIVDDIKNANEVELTLFFEDKRVITTLISDGKRIISTKSSEIWNEYVKYGKEYYKEELKIMGDEYTAYYRPIFGKNGDVIGMAFAGILSEKINSAVRAVNVLSVAVSISFCVISIILCSIIARRQFKIQSETIENIIEIDKGNFAHKIDDKILARKDEYGVINRYFVKLNDSLITLVEKDALTGLFNRRAAMLKLEKYVKTANTIGGDTFCFVIGDIDFFKKVNDTYGHNCGDLVLKKVSEILNDIPREKGFAARWGGEEFIIALSADLEETIEIVSSKLDKIREMSVDFDGKTVKVTMTFGVAKYISPQKLDDLISNADRLLYKGKESGRNRIVGWS